MGCCATQKPHTLTPSQVTSKSLQLSLSLINSSQNCIFYSVSQEELKLIQQVFADLSYRTQSYKSVDKPTLHQFFQLPGLISERLISSLNKTGSGFVNFEHFLVGLRSYCRTDFQEKSAFIFKLFDLCEDKFIDIIQLEICVQNLFKTVFFKQIKNNSHKQIKKYVKGVIQNYGEQNKMDILQFQTYLKQTNLIKYFNKAMKQKMWEILNNPEYLDIKALEKKHKNSQTFPEDYYNPYIGKIQQAGYIYTKPNSRQTFKKQTILLKGSFVLFLESLYSKTPTRVIYLQGCSIQLLGDYYLTNKFGFSIKNINKNYRQLLIWTDIRRQRDEWIRKLNSAASNRLFKQIYELNDRIKQGQQNDIYICSHHVTGQKSIVKISQKGKQGLKSKELLKQQISIMKILQHPNIIQLEQVFQTQQYVLAVIEYAKYGDLFDRIMQSRVLSEYQTCQIVTQILEALQYIHSCGIIHRDLKPQNILLTTQQAVPQIKLSDFGLSVFAIPNTLQYQPCGTLGYSAPQILNKSGYNNKVDLWSLGVITYLCLRGRLPFDHKVQQVAIDLTLRGNLNFSNWKHFTPQSEDFIRRLLERDPEMRMSAQEALQHPWIKHCRILIPRGIDKDNIQDLLIAKGLSINDFEQIKYLQEGDTQQSETRKVSRILKTAGY